MSDLKPIDPAALPALMAGQTARLAPALEIASVFTPDECARIIARRDVLGFDKAPIPTKKNPDDVWREHEIDGSVRETERTHLLPTREHAWIFDRMAAAVDSANDKAWQFRIAYMEPMQLLTYPPGGHFDWHADLADRGIVSLRKVSATVHLSAPEDYEDGQLLDAGKVITPGRGHGKAVFVPAYQQHRVTPVTRGTRHVLILWTIGKRPLR